MSSTVPRVVVTGMSAISPLGSALDEQWAALEQRRSGIDWLSTLPGEVLPTNVGGEARQFTGHIDDFGQLEKAQKRTIRKGLKLMCREIQMGVAAAQRALVHAQLQTGTFDPERTGVTFGCDYIMTTPYEYESGVGHCLDDDRRFRFSSWATEGLPQVTPLWLLKYLPNMPASHVAIYNDLRGPSNSVTMREASSNLAIGEAKSTLERGHADVLVVGTTGTRIHPLRTVHICIQEELARAEDDPSAASRPFEKHRRGMVLGEGAAALVLETFEHAQARGAEIVAEVVGAGSSAVTDKFDVARSGQALQNAMGRALDMAGMKPAEIGHVHAHGVGTQHGDEQEAQAIAAVFQQSHHVPVTAAKSYFGNLGAAGGMVELVASLQALEHGVLFPILNYETPDPACAIQAAQEDSLAGQSVLNLSCTPQGQASAVVLRRV